MDQSVVVENVGRLRRSQGTVRREDASCSMRTIQRGVAAVMLMHLHNMDVCPVAASHAGDESFRCSEWIGGASGDSVGRRDVQRSR